MGSWRAAAAGTLRLRALRLSPVHTAINLPPPHHAMQAFRVLKPGGTLILIQRLPGGPAQALLASGAGAVGEHAHFLLGPGL